MFVERLGRVVLLELPKVFGDADHRSNCRNNPIFTQIGIFLLHCVGIVLLNWRMSQAEAFLTNIETFLTNAQMTATEFGRASVNDPNFVFDVRAGRKPNLGLVDRVHDFMRAHGTHKQDVA